MLWVGFTTCKGWVHHGGTCFIPLAGEGTEKCYWWGSPQRHGDICKMMKYNELSRMIIGADLVSNIA